MVRTTILLMVALLAACASTPVTLVALPRAPETAVKAPQTQSTSSTVLLRPVILPGYLDNFPVVVGRSANTLIVAKNAEWAERLSDAVSRVLRDALSRHMGPSRVLIAGDGRIPDADLTIELLALDPHDGALGLDARWSFLCTARRAEAHAGRTQLQVPLAAASPTAVAAATAGALGLFAEALAAQAQCPSAPPPGMQETRPP